MKFDFKGSVIHLKYTCWSGNVQIKFEYHTCSLRTMPSLIKLFIRATSEGLSRTSHYAYMRKRKRGVACVRYCPYPTVLLITAHNEVVAR